MMNPILIRESMDKVQFKNVNLRMEFDHTMESHVAIAVVFMDRYFVKQLIKTKK